MSKYATWSNYQITNELKARRIKGSGKREVAIDRLVAHDNGLLVPPRRGTIVELPSISEGVRLPPTTNYKEPERPFLGAPIGILKLVCQYLDPISMCNFGKTCKLYYNDLFKPLNSQRLKNTLFHSLTDDEKLVSKLNKLSPDSFSPMALAYYLYRQTLNIGKKSTKGKEYTICVDLLKMLSTWKTVDVWLINQKAEWAEEKRKRERDDNNRRDRIDTINTIAISLGYLTPFDRTIPYFLQFTKDKITGTLYGKMNGIVGHLYEHDCYKYFERYVRYSDQSLDESVVAYYLNNLFELGVIDKSIVVAELEPEQKKIKVDLEQDSFFDIFKDYFECEDCDLGLCSWH